MKRIVIIGAGFGGIQAAVELEPLARDASKYEVLVISDQNYFMFTPLLPQIVSSFIDPRHIVQPVRNVRGGKHFRFLRDTVERIDVEARRVVVGPGHGDFSEGSEGQEDPGEAVFGQVASGDGATNGIHYDYLIVAVGSRTEYFKVPGARENSWDFKTLEDGVVLRERVIDACEHADHTVDAEERRKLLTFAIVGGGYTGVELITEIRDFLSGYVVKHYRNISRGDFHLLLLEATSKVLGGIDPLLRPHALKRLNQEGIEVRVNAKVTRVTEGVVELNGGEKLEAGTIIWAAGVRAHPLVEALVGPHDRIGRAMVNEYLQVAGHPEIFVIGDSAAAAGAEEAPRVAPVAISEGTLAAKNVGHVERGEKLEGYKYKSQGMLVSLGMNDAVVDVFGLKLHGFLAWIFWNAVHLFKLVGFKKQLQVAVDWSLGSLFPRDAAIIRTPRGCRICERERERQQSESRASDARERV